MFRSPHHFLRCPLRSFVVTFTGVEERSETKGGGILLLGFSVIFEGFASYDCFVENNSFISFPSCFPALGKEDCRCY